MRIHIISDVYPPEPMTSAVMACDIAESMVKRGHEVTVFSPFPNRPVGKVYPNYRRCWKQIEFRDDYRIIHSWHTLSKCPTLLSRIAENISFGITSTIQSLCETAPDVVYMNTWPIFAQWMNTFVLYKRRVPVICAVKDLYPETFLGCSVGSKINPLIRMAEAIDRQVYRQCALVVPLNSFTKDCLIATRSLSPDKVHVVHDWVDASPFLEDQPKFNGFRRKHKITSEIFLAMYVGSITRMAGLDIYINAAERLCHRKDIRILLVGDGGMRKEIEMKIQEKGLTNIQVIYPLKPEDVPEVQAASDVLMLSLLPGVADHTTPSKLMFYMFSTRPILAAVREDGPPARIIREAECGYVIPQNNAHDLADRLEKIADERASLKPLGQKARCYAEANFLKENALPVICNLIEKVGMRQFVGPEVTELNGICSVHKDVKK